MDVLEALRTSALREHFDWRTVIEVWIRCYAKVSERDGCPVPEGDLAYMRGLSLEESEEMFRLLAVEGMPHGAIIAQIRAVRDGSGS